MDMRKYLDPARPVRRWITVGLTLGGAVAGAAVGLALTGLGKILAGAPPADAANFVWNASAFGVIGAVVAPLATWSTLRAVPLWRTVVEPLIASLVAAGVGVLLGSGVAFLVLPPAAALAAVARLHFAHRPRALSHAESPRSLG